MATCHARQIVPQWQLRLHQCVRLLQHRHAGPGSNGWDNGRGFPPYTGLLAALRADPGGVDAASALCPAGQRPFEPGCQSQERGVLALGVARRKQYQHPRCADAEHLEQDMTVDYFGMTCVVPRIVERSRTVIAVNVGGAVIPTLGRCFGLAIRSAEGAAHGLRGGNHGKTLIGADLLNLDRLSTKGAPVASIRRRGYLRWCVHHRNNRRPIDRPFVHRSGKGNLTTEWHGKLVSRRVPPCAQGSNQEVGPHPTETLVLAHSWQTRQARRTRCQSRFGTPDRTDRLDATRWDAVLP